MAVRRTTCEAGALVRQHVRKILNDAKSHGYEDGVDVRWDEAKGWLDSHFTITIIGDERQVAIYAEALGRTLQKLFDALNADDEPEEESTRRFGR